MARRRRRTNAELVAAGLRDPNAPKLPRGPGNRNVSRRGNSLTVIRLARRTKAFDLRAKGLTYAKISEALGISPYQAQLDVERYISEQSPENTRRKIAVYTRTLEKGIENTFGLIEALLPAARGDTVDGKAQKADVEASLAIATHHRTLKLLVSEVAALNGLHAPQKVEHTGAAGGPLEFSLTDMLGAIDVGKANESAIQSGAASSESSVH